MLAPMKPVASLLVTLLLASGLATAGPQTSPCYPKSACKSECEAVKQEIRRIQARMRNGYGPSQGAKMEARLRDLRKLRGKLC